MSRNSRDNSWESNRDLGDLFSHSQKETEEKFERTQVEEFLNDLLKEINDHDYEAIDSHREEIEKKLASAFEDFETLLYGGSHSRYTNVNKMSDIDILAVLGNLDSLVNEPQKAIAQLASALRERFPQSKIHEGRMAVTINFSDGIEIQVLPAYRDKDSFYIPNPSKGDWVQTCPAQVSELLTTANQRLSNQLVPLIKLVKSICYSRDVPVKSYHIENMALKIFDGYDGPKTLVRMLKQFFNQAKGLCASPMRDPCGQSADVSGDLSQTDRTRMASEFNRIEERIDRGMSSQSIDAWKELFKK
jgi:hypothetical protein